MNFVALLGVLFVAVPALLALLALITAAVVVYGKKGK